MIEYLRGHALQRVNLGISRSAFCIRYGNACDGNEDYARKLSACGHGVRFRRPDDNVFLFESLLILVFNLSIVVRVSRLLIRK